MALRIRFDAKRRAMVNLQNISIVLCDTSHPGNIGSAARAMKTMGLSSLILVNPKQLPDHTSISLAAGADDILSKAKIVSDLKTALQDFSLIFATSARERFLKWPACSPEVAAEKMEQSSEENVAIIFGNERAGLSNEDLACAHFHVTIPTTSDFSSLNLAAAVQIIAYEIYKRSIIASKAPGNDVAEKNATFSEINGLIQHFETTMQRVGFLNTAQPRLLLQRLQRLLMRAELETKEINLLRGFLKAVNRHFE